MCWQRRIAGKQNLWILRYSKTSKMTKPFSSGYSLVRIIYRKNTTERSPDKPVTIVCIASYCCDNVKTSSKSPFWYCKCTLWNWIFCFISSKTVTVGRNRLSLWHFLCFAKLLLHFPFILAFGFCHRESLLTGWKLISGQYWFRVWHGIHSERY